MSIIQFIETNIQSDNRGDINIFEQFKNVPFDIKRVYCLTNSNHEPRGFHAHKNLQQVAVCLSGQCVFTLNNGLKKEDITLDTPNKALLINNMIWREMHDFSSDCVIMVLASDFYEESDYIRDYDDFISQVQKIGE